jgi:hypothetical protein
MPAVATKSLTAWGKPCKGPGTRPRANCSSASLAARMAASSPMKVGIALTLGLTRLICARKAVITAVADTSRLRIRRDSSTASLKQSSASGRIFGVAWRCDSALFTANSTMPSEPAADRNPRRVTWVDESALLSVMFIEGTYFLLIRTIFLLPRLYFRPKNRMRPTKLRPCAPPKARNCGESMLLLTSVGFCRLVRLLKPARTAQ